MPCRYERGQLGGRAKSEQYDGVTLELGEWPRCLPHRGADPPALLPLPSALLKLLKGRPPSPCASTGGSIIWHKNYLMKDLAAAAGLEVEEPPADGLLALYDGRQLVFAESQWRILTLIRMLLRYWLSWFSFRAAPAAVFQKFEGEAAPWAGAHPGQSWRICHPGPSTPPHPTITSPTLPGIYPLLDNNTIFERPEKLLQAVGLYELTQVRGERVRRTRQA
jgi:hypothetical protein